MWALTLVDVGKQALMPMPEHQKGEKEVARNLKYQFKYAIESAFKEGMDKHSIKHSEGMRKNFSPKIYSYADRGALIDFAGNLANFMRENFPEVKLAKDIHSEHVQAFLDSKAETCTGSTINQYIAKANKLNDLLESRYNTSIGFNRDLVRPITHEQTEKLRDIAMTRNDYNRIERAIQDSRSAGKVAFELAGRFGLRVSETTSIQRRDIDLNNKTLNIVGSKGGRSRRIEIKDKDMQYMRDLKNSLERDNARAVPIKEGSVNEFLRREMSKLELERNYTDCKTSFHAIRKMVAQEQYDQYRSEGLSVKDAWDKTSEFLGHGTDRIDLFATYVESRK